MLSPGISENRDYQIETRAMHERVEIFMEGDKIVETRQGLELKEKGHDPVIYLPRNEVKGVQLQKCGEYHCPFKGKAELYNVKHNSSIFENAAWSYTEPYDDVAEIRDMVAFYPGKVQDIHITG